MHWFSPRQRGASSVTTNMPVQPPYRHLTVNHSTNFVDPITHACTNSVEGRWKHVKRKLGAVNGSSTELLSGYLDEYLWRERYGKNGPTAFDNILLHIAEIYSEDQENQPNL